MTTSSNAQTTAKRYFDLHTCGIGYLNRIREVRPKKGEPFLACSINAFTGPVTEPAYRYFDVRVSGAKAQDLVRNCKADVDAGRPVLIEFRISDLWVSPYIATQGRNEGQPVATLKARLLTASLVGQSVLAGIEHYNLTTYGIGYLNRVRDLHPNEGDSLLTCTIASLNGPIDEPEYKYFNTTVLGDDVQDLVRNCSAAVNAKQSVLISFRMSDMQATPYLRTKGDRVGELAASFSSNLVHIGMIKIDGQSISPAKPVLEEATGESITSQSTADDAHSDTPVLAESV
ncbi:DUF3577 domain-containing protein [Pseudomonas sp. RC4D1]|uniref:DUF3577 domain-containing protein n=1 Tax=Pseudomonas sp. RC4D1 TaxID=2834407 RepID=UPI001BD17302|nr:DUF3577 domain-containing protein [Pseudomonas sp. RC4D1]MBS7560138.1 DUF3577 domain-containing protein [Pseudomonas sp. RC4D1]